ncbi:MAG: sugar phosphate isomerase/epimerase, partial [Firmicutes bacterium]|nr:sugar phosphate isomerase/epimerase [Bacillota bacterium]
MIHISIKKTKKPPEEKYLPLSNYANEEVIFLKLGFITACFPELNLEEIVKWASSEGFQALEVACWPSETKDRAYSGVHHIDVVNLDKAGAGKIKKLFESHGMEISSLAYYPNNLDPDMEKRKKHHGHLKKVIDAASLLGVKLVGTFTGRDPKKSTDESLKEFSEVFPPLVKYASGKKVKLMIENCP